MPKVTKAIKKAKEYDGLPKLSDFEVVEIEISTDLAEGELLTEAMYISVDPYLRVYPMEPGNVVGAFQLAKVIESKSSKHPVGSLVYQHGAWQQVIKTNEQAVWANLGSLKHKISPEDFMGAVGMTGLSAYFGFLNICEPKKGETVMVSGCSGAVGSIVGQIAKIKGCSVIGSCGSDEKVEKSKSIGFDGAFNYKTEKDWSAVLKKLAPNGIDCYFDNVGGQMSADVMSNMNMYGRISVCGCISTYNRKAAKDGEEGAKDAASGLNIKSNGATAPLVQPAMIGKRLKMQGFIVRQFLEKMAEGTEELVQWVVEGKLKGRVHITEGFENIPQAFIGMLSGANIGKAAVKV